jgi:molybdenum cofactor biosynthesis enzyme MoaA
MTTKLTKPCFDPWTIAQVNAGGAMQCCCRGPDSDMGDFILDYLEAPPGATRNPLCHSGLLDVREGLLTGNLRPMCQDCNLFSHTTWITTAEFKKRLRDMILKKNPGIDISTIDLRTTHAYSRLCFGLTNRCDLSCVYCAHSTSKHNNPFLKMEMSFEHGQRTLDFFARAGIGEAHIAAFGEATLSHHWYPLISEFHAKYPDVNLVMTTNLNRKYSDKEMELIAQYTWISVSIDSLDVEMSGKLRVHSNLERILNNLRRIDEASARLGKERPLINLQPVVSSMNYRHLEALADFAFSNGYGINLLNYREEKIALAGETMRMLVEMPLEEQHEAEAIIRRIQEKAKEGGCRCNFLGDFFQGVTASSNQEYHVFIPYGNPVLQKFYENDPKGSPAQHLGIVYDLDNVSHEGILLANGETLTVAGLGGGGNTLTVREIHRYKPGTGAARYNQSITLRPRTRVKLENGCFSYPVKYPNENVTSMLLEICDYF